MREMMHRSFCRLSAIGRCMLYYITAHHQMHRLTSENLGQPLHILRIGNIYRYLLREQIHLFHIRSRHGNDLSAHLKRLGVFGPGKLIRRQPDAKASFPYISDDLLVTQGKGIKGPRKECDGKRSFLKRMGTPVRKVIVQETVNPVQRSSVKIHIHAQLIPIQQCEYFPRKSRKMLLFFFLRKLTGAKQVMPGNIKCLLRHLIPIICHTAAQDPFRLCDFLPGKLTGTFSENFSRSFQCCDSCTSIGFTAQTAKLSKNVFPFLMIKKSKHLSQTGRNIPGNRILLDLQSPDQFQDDLMTLGL